MTDPALLTEGPRPAVRLERHLTDPPSVVWQALTEREQLRSWFPCDVIVDGGQWVIGAAISFPFPPEVIDMTLTGEVLVVDEPKTLAFTWGEETLRFELAPRGDGTYLVLIDELPASAAARNAAGWQDCLDRLAGLSQPRTPGDHDSSNIPLPSNQHSAPKTGRHPPTTATHPRAVSGESTLPPARRAAAE